MNVGLGLRSQSHPPREDSARVHATRRPASTSSTSPRSHVRRSVHELAQLLYVVAQRAQGGPRRTAPVEPEEELAGPPGAPLILATGFGAPFCAHAIASSKSLASSGVSSVPGSFE